MLKKIALIGIFALTSIVSFGTAQVRAAKGPTSISVTSPVPQGICGNPTISRGCRL